MNKIYGGFYLIAAIIGVVMKCDPAIWVGCLILSKMFLDEA